MRRDRRLWVLFFATPAAAWALLPAAPAGATAPPGRFQITTNATPDDLTDDTVVDTKTQLRWQRMFSPLVIWDVAAGPGTAQAYCAGLTVGTYGGWRLPTVKELVTVLDVRSHPAFDPKIFPNVALWIETGSTPRFWASTPYIGSASTSDAGVTSYSSAWVFGPGSGHSQPWTANNNNVARCVRAQ
jgi:hypothetical protein